MSTNFYFRGHRHDGDPNVHVGKRSAAGHYCWDCHVTLRKGLECRIREGEFNWHRACPRCGATPDIEPRRGGAARGYRLDGMQYHRSSVRGCCSFLWAMERAALDAHVAKCETESGVRCPSCVTVLKEQGKIIEDEYRRLYTEEEFRRVLEGCPIQSTRMVGEVFS